jgi:hypothetical protein
VRLACAWFCAIFAWTASAQDLEPRAYANTPIGLNFVLSAYTYQDGGASPDPTVPLTDASAHMSGATIAYARSFDLLGNSAKFDIVLPYAWFSGSAKYAGQLYERDVSGLGDPRFRVSVNFYGAPALTMKEFASYHQDLIVGASLYVWAPWSQYDPTKVINIGTNRWAFKAELGASKAVGQWTFELVPGVTFFTDNTDFFNGHTRSQDPLYSVQAHVIYGFESGVWLAVDGTYFTGGQTSLNGVADDDRQANSRIGATLALPIDRNNSMKLYASRGVSTRIGSDFNTFGVAWQYRWGGGL